MCSSAHRDAQTDTALARYLINLNCKSFTCRSAHSNARVCFDLPFKMVSIQQGELKISYSIYGASAWLIRHGAHVPKERQTNYAPATPAPHSGGSLLSLLIQSKILVCWNKAALSCAHTQTHLCALLIQLPVLWEPRALNRSIRTHKRQNMPSEETNSFIIFQHSTLPGAKLYCVVAAPFLERRAFVTRCCIIC